MISLLLDCDEYLAAEHLARAKAQMGDADMADLNTSELTAQTSAGEILGSASMMPFLAAKRLILVRGYLGQLEKRMAASKSTGSAAHGEAAQLLDGFAELPDSADIVFIDSVDKRRHLWKGFTIAKPAAKTKSADKSERKVIGLAEQIETKRLSHVQLAPPDPKALAGWIAQRAKSKKIAIDGQAVRMMADYVGVNLRQLDNELDKLSAYAHQRSINANDIKLLVSDASESLIWDLTDAISQRNGRKAMRSLYELRRGDANPFYLLTMIARQYRIMIKVKEASATLGNNEYDIAKAVKESAYPVKKALQLARKHSADDLVAVMDRLLTADYAMKTGADPETEIDVLVAELTR